MNDVVSPGALKSEEQDALQECRKEMQALFAEIGRLWYQQMAMGARVGRLEDSAQNILNGVGERLQIPKGVGWQIDGSGVVWVKAPPVPEVAE